MRDSDLPFLFIIFMLLVIGLGFSLGSSLKQHWPAVFDNPLPKTASGVPLD